MANYKISQVTIEVKPGVKLIAEVSNLTDLKRGGPSWLDSMFHFLSGASQ